MKDQYGQGRPDGLDKLPKPNDASGLAKSETLNGSENQETSEQSNSENLDSTNDFTSKTRPASSKIPKADENHFQPDSQNRPNRLNNSKYESPLDEYLEKSNSKRTKLNKVQDDKSNDFKPKTDRSLKSRQELKDGSAPNYSSQSNSESDIGSGIASGNASFTPRQSTKVDQDDSEETSKREGNKTESEDDVVWGPPISPDSKKQTKKVKSRSKKNTPIKNPGTKVPLTPEPPRPSNWQSSRSEADVYQDLSNSVVSEKVVYDNSPVIAEELAQRPTGKPIVLKAQPSEFYHASQRLAAEKRLRDDAIRKKVPVIQAKSRTSVLRKQKYDFSELPGAGQGKQSELPESKERNLRTEQSDEAYRRELRDAIYSNSEALFNYLPEMGLTNSGDMQRSQIEAHVSQLPKTSEAAKLPARKSATILLRAVPEGPLEIQRIKKMGKRSHAQFQFRQPKYQRAVENWDE